MLALEMAPKRVVNDFAALQALNPRSIVVFGGTFDPPHNGHLELAKVISSLADLVVILPAARNPLKAHNPEASDEDRIEMLKLAFGGQRNIYICQAELRRNPNHATFTIDTVYQAARELPECKLKFVFGSDCLRQFHTWKNWQQIVEMTDISFVHRHDGREIDWRMITNNLGEENVLKLKSNFIESSIKSVSSSDLRATLKVDIASAAKELPAGVFNHIIKKSLYY